MTSKVQQDREYELFLKALQINFQTNSFNWPVFKVVVDDLYLVYLRHIPEKYRQYHNCHACRRFFEQYGGLVVIDMFTGKIEPAFWSVDDAPDELKTAVSSVISQIKKAKIASVFVSELSVYGHPVTGDWTHLSLTPHYKNIHKAGVFDAYEVSAKKTQDYLTVELALKEYPIDIINQALNVIKSEQLLGGERILGQAEFLANIHTSQVGKTKVARQNMLWLAIAQAPDGFCHPRSSMISTLLDDLRAGYDIDVVKTRFAKKMYGTKYRRPVATPKAGAIVAAQDIIDRLGIATSLERRYMRLDEVQSLWKPTPCPRSIKQTQSGGMITWTKFQRTVLPTAKYIEILTPPGSAPYVTLLTAANKDAPPIIQWDDNEVRNPASWYLYSNGSVAENHGLLRNNHYEVTAVALQPSMWNYPEKFKHQGEGVIFLIKGASDVKTPKLCLFPSILKSELHSISSYIENYSNNNVLRPAYGDLATGLIFQNGSTASINVRVHDSKKRTDYVISSWD